MSECLASDTVYTLEEVLNLCQLMCLTTKLQLIAEENVLTLDSIVCVTLGRDTSDG